MPEDKKESGGSGLSLQTLLISASAAVAAATLVPLFWEQGTILATAMTPVIVALVSEGLRKPVQSVSAVAPRVTRRSGTGAAVRRFVPAAERTRERARAGARGDGVGGGGVFDPLPPDRRGDAPAPRGDDPYGLRGADRRRRPRLKIALVTGALAFVIAAAAVTVSELALFGGSVGSDRRTSLFGGQQSESATQDRGDEEASPTATPGAEATPSAEATATPEDGATPEPAVTPEPTPTPAPTEAAPVPTPTP